MTAPQTIRSFGIAGVIVVCSASYAALHLHSYPAATVISFTMALAVFLFNVVSVPLFILALRNYKHDFKRAYGMICSGAILYGLAQLQFSSIALLNIQFLVSSGLVIIPFALAVGLIYGGLRRFGRLLQLHSNWLSYKWAYGTALILAVGSVFIPSVSTSGLPSAVTQFANGFNVFITVIVLFTTVTVYRIRNTAAVRYRTALGWMLASMVTLLISVAHYATISLFIPLDHWYFTYSLPLIPTLVGTILLFQTSYRFNYVEAEVAKATHSSSPVDAVIYMASLASSPQEIDSELNTLRAITATADNNSKALTRQQEVALSQLYTKLEDYLVHREALRVYTRAGLKESIRNRFQPGISVFWKAVDN